MGVAAVAVVAGGGGTTAWAFTGGDGPQLNSAVADAQAHRQRQEPPRADRDHQRTPLPSASPKSTGKAKKNASATTMLRAEKAKPQAAAPSSSGGSGHGHKSLGGGTCEASNYGGGGTTASGEPLNSSAMTAAHKTLPFGTKLRVTNTANGRSVVVRVNDRGPYVAGRCLDLTTGAFSRIASMGAGVATVRYSVLSMG
ncbi:MAG TPA: septal ring lytic transglycosylase RlpA family protein [Streptosporangiaceae bacterium]